MEKKKELALPVSTSTQSPRAQRQTSSGTIDVSISNKIQEMEERISGAEDSIENIDTTIKENTKYKKILTQNIQEIQDTMRRPNLRKNRSR
jgi:cell division protein FtsL